MRDRTIAITLALLVGLGAVSAIVVLPFTESATARPLSAPPDIGASPSAPIAGTDALSSDRAGLATTVADERPAGTVDAERTALAASELSYRSPDRIDLLEVRSTGSGEYAYRFTVEGYVQRTRVSDQLKAEHNDELTRNGDGTITVVGTTGNEQSDLYAIRGTVRSFRKLHGESGGQPLLNGRSVSIDTLLTADLLEVVSTDADEEVRYTFTVRGRVARTRTADDIAAGDTDDISTRDGLVTVRGVTGNEAGDAYRIEGRITSFRRTGGDSGYLVLLDGLQVDPGSFGTSPPDEGTDNPRQVRTVDDCTVIDEPGRYRLTEDVRNSRAPTCISITADEVTFDGDGHRIDGRDDEDTVGIAVTGPRGATVRDVVVRDVVVSDWETGIDAGSVRDRVAVSSFVLRDVTARSNARTGVSLDDAAESRLRGLTVVDSGLTGVSLWELDQNNVLTESTITDNGGYGVIAFEGGNGLAITDNTVTGNDRGGIGTSNDDTDVTIARNLVASNGRNGLDLDESTGITVRDNDVRNNEGAGVHLEDVGDDAVILANRVRGNGAEGVAVLQTPRATVRANVVTGNDRVGIRLGDSDDSLVVGNTVCDNAAGPQIVLEDSSDVRLANNDETCR